MLGLRTYTMLFALAVGPANAAVVTYGSTTTNPAANNSGTYVDMRALWESLTSGQMTVDFNNVPSYTQGGGFLNYDTALYTVGNPNAAWALTAGSPGSPSNSTTAQFTRLGQAYRTYVVSDPLRAFTGAGPGANQIQVNVPTSAPITSLAMDLTTTYSGGGNITVDVYDANDVLIGTYIVSTVNSSTPAFFGLTSDTAISYIRLSSFAGNVALSRFDFGAMVAETPESASLGYVGLGILAILLGTNKKLKMKR